MNKVAAEIIAGVIPHKMTRNRWRGILRYGIINAIKLKWRIRHNHTSPEHYLAVCAIAKNEGVAETINTILRGTSSQNVFDSLVKNYGRIDKLWTNIMPFMT